MTDFIKVLKRYVSKGLGLGILLFVSGCSLASKQTQAVQTQAVQSQPQVGCASRVVNDSICNEITPNELDSIGNDSVGDSMEVSLALGQADEDPSRSSLVLLPDLNSDEQATSASGAAETIPTPITEPSSELRLQDVIDSVYSSYPLLQVAFNARLIADGELLSSQGGFDLKLKGGGTSGPLGFYKTYRYGTGVSQPLFSGGEVFGGYKIGRGNFQPWFGERQTNDGGEFSAGFAIPLAQNRQIDARRAALFRATYGRDAVEPDIQTQTIAFVWKASYTYWQWVAAGRNHQIARSLLEIARQRNKGLRKRVDVGDLPRIELTDNQRLIVSRQATLIEAKRKLQQSAIKLSLFLRTPDGLPTVPSEDQLPPAFPEATSVDSDQMDGDIQSALSNRPELVLLELLRMQLDVDLAQARNLYLPMVDAVLYASQDMGGAASSKRDKTPFELEASLQVSLPLQRRKARGKIQSIEGKRQQLSVKIGFTQDKIVTEVQQVYAALLAAYDRIAKARQSLELAHTMEEAERRKFDLGDSNLLLVNLRELSTADAAKTVLQTLLDYFQAQADYRAAMALDVNQEGAS